jgi:hypothetical protein
MNQVLRGIVLFNKTSTGNAGRFKKIFTMVFQTLFSNECYENVYT